MYHGIIKKRDKADDIKKFNCEDKVIMGCFKMIQ